MHTPSDCSIGGGASDAVIAKTVEELVAKVVARHEKHDYLQTALQHEHVCFGNFSSETCLTQPREPKPRRVLKRCKFC